MDETTTTGHDGDGPISPTSSAAEAAAELAGPPGERSHKGWQAGKKRGTCQECGRPADGPSATWCAEHRPIKKDGAPRPTGRAAGPSHVAQLEDELRTNLEMAAQLWAVKDPFCAHVLLPRGAIVKVPQPILNPENPLGPPLRVEMIELQGQGAAADIAHFWAERALHSANVARVLEGVVSSGGWLGGLAVHAPLVMAIWAHHVMPAVAARREAAMGAEAATAPPGTMPGMPYGPPPADDAEHRAA